MTEQPPLVAAPMAASSDEDGPIAPTFIEQPATPGLVAPEKGQQADQGEREQGEVTDWKAEADHWKSESKRWEQRARDNVRDVDKAKKTAEQRVSELEAREAIRAQNYALQLIRTDVATAGIDPAEVEDLLATVDPGRFLDRNGEADLKAIKTYSATLTRFAGRIPPDPDQGKTGGKPEQTDMNSLIRRAAGRNR